MRNRKDKPIGIRLLSACSAFLFMGAVIYGMVSGISMYTGALVATALLGLAVPSVSAGENLLDILVGTIEMFLDGLMEVIGGIFDAVSSFFG